MLIRRAEIDGHTRERRLADLRLLDGRIAALGELEPAPGETVIDAAGGAVLPGLHDHHLHLFALAAARASVFCGPPEVVDEAGLAARLVAAPGAGWLRGIGYHESVAGDIDRVWLDRLGPDRPVRVQHRGGRRWILNSRALEILLAGQERWPAQLDAARGHLDDGDGWIRTRLAGQFPDLGDVSRELASYGITGVTEMTPANDAAALAFISAQQAGGKLLQRVILAGRPDLPDRSDAALQVRYAKLHLHEARLPDYDETCRTVVASHAHGRPVAIHCVTLAELVFALGVLADAGVLPGDRIEHAGIAADEQVAAIAALGLIVVTQPNFIAERGDAYRADVEPAEQPWLYRGAAFLKAGVALAAGSDAPFGRPDPWAAMAAAVTRQSAAGHTIGLAERLTPEQALMLYLGQGDAPQQARRIAVGAPADLCLLDRDWSAARTEHDRSLVKLTVRGGETLFTRPSAGRSPP